MRKSKAAYQSPLSDPTKVRALCARQNLLITHTQKVLNDDLTQIEGSTIWPIGHWQHYVIC